MRSVRMPRIRQGGQGERPHTEPGWEVPRGVRSALDFRVWLSPRPDTHLPFPWHYESFHKFPFSQAGLYLVLFQKLIKILILRPFLDFELLYDRMNFSAQHSCWQAKVLVVITSSNGKRPESPQVLVSSYFPAKNIPSTLIYLLYAHMPYNHIHESHGKRGSSLPSSYV